MLAVAGTHGKTTHHRRCWPGSWKRAGLQPGFLIGGVPLNFGISARLGRVGTAGERMPFVIEADEYDTAFFDKRSKFVHYRPSTAVLNNLEYDHADIFPDLDAIETQFHHLVRTVPASGRLVVNAREESLVRVLARGCWSEIERFGVKSDAPGLRARGEPHAFDVLKSGVKVARVEWDLLGEHNQLNALAAMAAAEHVGVAPTDAARRWRASRTCGAGSSCAARPPASRSTTISRTIRPRSAPPSMACAEDRAGLGARAPRGAHPGHASSRAPTR